MSTIWYIILAVFGIIVAIFFIYKGRKRKKVTLQNDFILQLNKLFYKKLLNRIRKVKEVDDIHSWSKVMNSNILEKEYKLSVSDCFDFILTTCNEVLSAKHVRQIKEKESEFLTVYSTKLCDLWLELDLSKEEIANNVTKSAMAKIFTAFKIEFQETIAGAEIGASIGSVVPAVGNIVGFLFGGIVGSISSFFRIYDIAEKEKEIINNWYSLYHQSMNEYDNLWRKLCDTLAEFSRKMPIELQYDVKI